MPRCPVSRNVLVILVLIAAAAALRGVTWASALPAWQGPDELAHYSYVERLAGGGLPPRQLGPPRDSPAVEASLAATAHLRFRFRTDDRPLSAGLRAALPRERANLSEAGYGARGASNYPPAYYLLALPFYAFPGLETATERLFAMRMLSALLAAGVVVATFLLVLEATGRPGLALAAGALVSLPPMMGQASGIVNPDILLSLALAGLAWALVRRRGRATTTATVHVAAWAALAVAAKPVGSVLVLCVLGAFVVVPAVLRSPRLAALAVAAGSAGGVGLAVLGIVGGERIRAPYEYGARYLLDFYRPRLPAFTGEVAPAPAWSVWVESGVGSLGSLTVWLPQWAYLLGFAIVLLGGCASVWGLLADRRQLPFAASCAAAVFASMAVLHLAEVESLLEGHGPLLQGRYLTAVAPLAVGGFVAAVSSLPSRATWTLVGAVLGAWALIAFAGLDSVVSYFGS